MADLGHEGELNVIRLVRKVHSVAREPVAGHGVACCCRRHPSGTPSAHCSFPRHSLDG